jgi:DNA-binding NarL/FixJ family response regulator
MICTAIIGGQEPEQYTKFIASQTDISILGQGRDGYEVIKMVSELKPDIALLDENLPPVDISNIIQTLKSRFPKIRIIILTAAYDNTRILKAISRGASGYLLKNTRQEKFIAGIKTVYNGGCLMTQETAAKAFKMFSDANKDVPAKADSLPARKETPFPLQAKISRQELRVMLCISKGLSTREISKRLSIKEGTVRNYITSILKKTGLKNRGQLIIYTYKQAL